MREGIELTGSGDLDTTPAASGEGPSGHIVITGQGLAGAGRVPTLYAHAVEKAGGIAKVFSPFDQLKPDEIIPEGLQVRMDVAADDMSPLDGAVGLLLPGGGDIDPINYGEPRHPRSRGVSRERDRLESNLLREALRRDMPVLCICRGFQLLNVVLGGTLDQHLADSPDRMDHDRDMPRAEPVHRVRIQEDSLLADLFGVTDLPVNSHHHQGLCRVAGALRETAWAGDGVLEGVQAPDYSWVVGVQWHPEVMAPVDHRQMRLFEAFIEATRAFEAARNAA